jgi:hypothetical protein
MLLIILLLIHSVLFSMEREETIVISPHEVSSPYGVASSATSMSEEDDLCDFAMSKLLHPCVDVTKYIKPHLKEMLTKKNDSFKGNVQETNVDILRKVRSQDNQCSAHDQAINEMVAKAIHKAFEEKEKILEAKERRIKEKYSGKKTATIAGITGFISTIVTTICATMITLSSKSSK